VISEDLLSFIKASIRSTWALELLLLMRKQAHQAFAPEELVRALRSTGTLISTCLEQLQQAGLVVREESGAWRYAPAAPALDQLTAELETAYAERPVAVINAIMTTTSDRLKSFADAFRFPKKDD
jgi:DNA-binding IclR family transcriptional regulator